jgi:uncharacterized coiled-coil protein SlyX
MGTSQSQHFPQPPFYNYAMLVPTHYSECPNTACAEARADKQKYQAMLEDQQKSNKEDVKALKDTITDQKKTITELREDVKCLQDDVNELKRRLGPSVAMRQRLLGGSIAYAFLARMNAFVFHGAKKYETLQLIFDNSDEKIWEEKVIPLFQQADLDLTDPDEFALIDKFLSTVKQERFSDAHPTRLTEADEDRPTEANAPTVAQLENVIKEVLIGKGYRQVREAGVKLLLPLQNLTFAQHKKSLLDL